MTHFRNDIIIMYKFKFSKKILIFVKLHIFKNQLVKDRLHMNESETRESCVKPSRKDERFNFANTQATIIGTDTTGFIILHNGLFDLILNTEVCTAVRKD